MRNYEVRWLDNNKTNSRNFYNRETVYDFKKYLIEQGNTNIDLYYRNKKIATYNKINNIDWDTDYIIRCKVELSDMEISLGYMPYFEEMFIGDSYLNNRLILIKAQINYCLDTYPLNKDEFNKLSKEYNKINKQLEIKI